MPMKPVGMGVNWFSFSVNEKPLERGLVALGVGVLVVLFIRFRSLVIWDYLIGIFFPCFVLNF